MVISKSRMGYIKNSKSELRESKTSVGDNRKNISIQRDRSQTAQVVHPAKDIEKWKDNKGKSDLAGYDTKKRFKSYSKVKRKTGHSGDSALEERPQEYTRKYLPAHILKKIKDFASFKRELAKEWIKDPSLRNLLNNSTDKGLAHLYNTQRIQEALKQNTGKDHQHIRIGASPLEAIQQKINGKHWKVVATGFINNKSVGQVRQDFMKTGQKVYRDSKGRFASIHKTRKKGLKRTTRIGKTTKLKKPLQKPNATQRKEKVQALVDSLNETGKVKTNEQNKEK